MVRGRLGFASYIVAEDGTAIACGYEHGTVAGNANAQLIAAAPDLYDALKEICDALIGAQAANPEASAEFFEEIVEIEPGYRTRMCAALAQARGEQ